MLVRSDSKSIDQGIGDKEPTIGHILLYMLFKLCG